MKENWKDSPNSTSTTNSGNVKEAGIDFTFGHFVLCNQLEKGRDIFNAQEILITLFVSCGLFIKLITCFQVCLFVTPMSESVTKGKNYPLRLKTGK